MNAGIIGIDSLLAARDMTASSLSRGSLLRRLVEVSDVVPELLVALDEAVAERSNGFKSTRFMVARRELGDIC